jgi:3-oxoacyl-[acyl-carrier-protein] synthase III
LCLENSELAPADISLLLSVGTYRSEHLMEPAVAALLAERLDCNIDPLPQSQQRTFAFDVINGSAGFLKGCYLATKWITEGKGYAAMVVASEIENNRDLSPDHFQGLEEMASATLLEEALDDSSGFLDFHFRDFPEHLALETSIATPQSEGKCVLKFHRDAGLLDRYLDCIEVTLQEFLAEQKLSLDEIRWILPPQISEEFTEAFIKRLDADAARIPVHEKPNADMRTSSTPALLEALMESGRIQPGDLGLLINVGSGIQVGCALYQF